MIKFEISADQTEKRVIVNGKLAGVVQTRSKTTKLFYTSPVLLEGYTELNAQDVLELLEHMLGRRVEVGML